MIKEIEFKINGMKCGGCVSKVENAIININGIENVLVDLKTKTVNIEFDENNTCENHIFKAVESLNYKIIR